MSGICRGGVALVAAVHATAPLPGLMGRVRFGQFCSTLPADRYVVPGPPAESAQGSDRASELSGLLSERLDEAAASAS